jgi:hypothetical protein
MATSQACGKIKQLLKVIAMFEDIISLTDDELYTHLFNVDEIKELVEECEDFIIDEMEDGRLRHTVDMRATVPWIGKWICLRRLRMNMENRKDEREMQVGGAG